MLCFKLFYINYLLIWVVCWIRCKKFHIIFSFFYIIRIKRKEQHLSQSNTQMFTSQLYSKLEENNDNENGVMRWSRRKDIFNKKIVFIPIEKGLHWVLCIVINPGMIHNNTKISLLEISSPYSIPITWSMRYGIKYVERIKTKPLTICLHSTWGRF